jgi:hypothetical protein
VPGQRELSGSVNIIHGKVCLLFLTPNLALLYGSICGEYEANILNYWFGRFSLDVSFISFYVILCNSLGILI